MENLFDEYRNFLKDTIRQSIDFRQTDQSKGIAPPPVEKPYAADSYRIDLVTKDNWRHVASQDLVSVIQNRRSYRNFKAEPLTLEDLSFLLWATQGITKIRNETAAFIIGAIVYLWPVIDVTVRKESFYENYPYG